MNKLRTFFILIVLSISVQAQSDEACHVDIDGNGVQDALTDGLIIIRALFGLSGTALTSNALGAGATRNAAQIKTLLAENDCLAMTDVDGNGQIDALTDGLILIRSLFGLTGTSLVQDALGNNALRKNDAAILNHLASYSNQRSIVIEANDLAPNAAISDAKQQVIIRNIGTSASNVRVMEGVDHEGNPSYRIISEQGRFEIELPDPEAALQQRGIDQTTLPVLQSRESIGWDDNEGWQLLKQGWKWFAKHGDIEGRLPPGIAVYNVSTCEIFDCQEGELDRPGWFNDVNVRTKPSYQLLTMCDSSDACLHEGEPVLFIHGFLVGDSLGGGRGTWGDFPRLLSSRFYKPNWEMSDEWQTTNHIPFEFRWRTNARFQDVAHDLYTSIKIVHHLTGKKVHLVAHSFGGVLVRTLLQGVGEPDSSDPVADIADVANYIASVATVGSPMSGIADKTQSMFGVNFPVGQDTQGLHNLDIFSFEACDQLSCQQMGEDVLFQGQADLYRVNNDPGWLASRLAITTGNLPDLDMLTLIGLTTPRGLNVSIDQGDGLITAWGQRFHPSLGLNAASDNEDWDQLLLPGLFQPANIVGKARVTERVLGMEGGQPGAANIWGDFRGYRHSTVVNGDGTSECITDGTANAIRTLKPGTPITQVIKLLGNVLFACYRDLASPPTLQQLERDTPVEPYVLYCDSLIQGLCHNDHHVLSEVKNWIRLNSEVEYTSEIISLTSSGLSPEIGQETKPSISRDGRFVVFLSLNNLVPEDHNEKIDVYVRDRYENTTRRVSVSSNGTEANDGSLSASISADGNYIVFSSLATNLVSGDTNEKKDIFIHHLPTGQTDRIISNMRNEQGNGDSIAPGINEDGRYIVFTSTASNFVDTDHPNNVFKLYVYDQTTGQISYGREDGERASKNVSRGKNAISANGEYVVSVMGASKAPIHIYDRVINSTILITKEGHDNTYVDTASFSNPMISSDSETIVFLSRASFSEGKFIGWGNRSPQRLYLFNRITKQIRKIEINPANAQIREYKGTPSVSDNGRYILFETFTYEFFDDSSKNRLFSGVYVYDTVNDSFKKIGEGSSVESMISGDGNFAVYQSSNKGSRIFVHDLRKNNNMQ